MAPSIPRRHHSPQTQAQAQSTAKKRTAPITNKAEPKTKTKPKPKPKPTLFDTLDAPKAGIGAAEAHAFLAQLNGASDDQDSDMSDADSDDFEDVPQMPPVKRRKVADDDDDNNNNAEESDEMDFEDVVMSHQNQSSTKINSNDNDNDDDSIGDINISLNDDGTVAAEAVIAGNKNVKKGPSKRDRQIRLRTHMIHVQSLVFHNAVRNSWLNDKEVQSTLVRGLSEGVKKEVERWKIDMGYQKPPPPPKGKKGKRKSDKTKDKDKRDGRDWGADAGRLETGTVNMSSGDPLLRLLKVLAAYWKKRFTITAPGIRKQGYMPLRQLTDDIKHWQKTQNDAEEHGERIETIESFRKLANHCEGSRDVGAQLFTALIRGLGIEARMIASLQPVGFGWSKAEDAAPKKPRAKPEQKADAKSDDKSAITISDNESDSVQEVQPPNKKTPIKPLTPQKPTRSSAKGSKTTVDQSDSSDSELSSLPSDDDLSIIDITPTVAPKSKKRPTKKFDRDLPFPHYWTEVLSPVSNTFIPVDSIVLSTVASNAELLATFEPRGKVADQAKQVICYTLAYNADSTAKDVTVRYLKKHQLPGRTKGLRMMPERVPIYNKRGKILRYEEQDWFGEVMIPFSRLEPKRTPADKKEDTTTLVPFKPASAGEGKQKHGEESLQWYKQSADFVLERHFRREEALLPNAAPVRTFTSGKGDKAKSEPVYSRSDVVVCKTVESWHKEGRQINVGEQPLKMVPVRAVTLIRKREMEEAQRETGEKLKQGLYSKDQTDWIIPPPIGPDRRIPKNAFGNMDCYVPSMVPRGSVHIRLKGCAKLCRKMDIDHAEACVGFEFGKQRAVPILFGVVVAEENEQLVRDAWKAEQEIQRRKEDVKREALVLHLWRKFVMGLRIVERMKAEYKDNGGEEVNPFVNRDRQQRKTQPKEIDLEAGSIDGDVDGDGDGAESMPDADNYGGGGFFLPGEEEALLSGPKPTVHAKIEEEDDDPYAGGGGFILDEDEEEEKPGSAPKKTSGSLAPVKPMSLQSAARRSLPQSDSSEGEDEEEDEEEEKEEKVEIEKSSSGRRGRPSAAAATAKSKKPVPASNTKTSQAKAKLPTKRGAKRVATPSETEEGSASELTDLSSVAPSASEDERVEDVKPRTSAVRRTSPRVVITPKFGRMGSIKSRFFNDRNSSRQVHEEDDDMEDEAELQDYDDVDDDEDEIEDEEEVIKPRRTTARTRKSLA